MVADTMHFRRHRPAVIKHREYRKKRKRNHMSLPQNTESIKEKKRNCKVLCTLPYLCYKDKMKTQVSKQNVNEAWYL